MNEDTMRELRLATDCAGLEMEFLELAANAARYELLRQHYVDSYIACGKLERLDAEIDSAMERKP